jgi:Holliday junction DNA helicase RuvA
MIGYLSGIVQGKGENWVLVVPKDGVGYKVFVPADVLLSAKEGEPIALFCHHHFSQDSESLYGFADRKDLELFELLLTISGIGPKAGLSILSRAKPSEIEQAIMKEDEALFTAVSGLGQKKAARIIVELKPKLEARGTEVVPGAPTGGVADLLRSLGYRRDEIQRALREIPKDLKSDEERVKWALRSLYR